MSLVHRYAMPLADAEGRTFVVEAHGERGANGLWEGRLEFVGIGRRIVLRTEVETRQPDRRALVHWASGLRASYLEGALTRALRARVAAFKS